MVGGSQHPLRHMTWFGKMHHTTITHKRTGICHHATNKRIPFCGSSVIVKKGDGHCKQRSELFQRLHPQCKLLARTHRSTCRENLGIKRDVRGQPCPVLRCMVSTFLIPEGDQRFFAAFQKHVCLLARMLACLYTCLLNFSLLLLSLS